MIDPSALDAAERAAVLRAIAELSPPEQWKEIRIQSGQNLFGIAQDEYRYTDGHSPRESRAIVDIIAEANNIKDPAFIRTGQSLRVPVLPVRPLSRGADPRFVQSFSGPGTIDFNSATEAFAGVGELSEGVGAKATQPEVTETATRRATYPTPTPSTPPQEGSADVILPAATTSLTPEGTPPAPRQEVTATPQISNVSTTPRAATADLARAAIWHLNPSEAESIRFLEMLPETVKAKLLYDGPGADVWAPLEPLQLPGANVEPGDAEVATVATRFRNAAASLKGAAASKYVVLDFFQQPGGSACGHGEKVQDVIRLRLEELGAPQLQSNVVLVDLDFSKNRAANLLLLGNYLSREMPIGSKVIVNSMLDAITKIAKSKGEFDVPVLYLQALLSQYVTDTSVSVISSQFVTAIEPFRLLPRTYGSNSKVCLVSGVLNVQNSYIEKISELEPLKSYWENRHNYGVLLIAGIDAQANILTMSSEKGDGVTCGARGIGWGKPGDCITPSDWGTSYATPAYATDMFVLRALWEQDDGAPLEAREVRRRLLLASKVALPVVSKLTCGGILDVGRARLAPSAVAVKANGEAERVELGEAWVNTSSNAAKETWQRINKSDGTAEPASARYAGIQFVEQQGFIFEEPAERWAPTVVTGLTVTMTGEDGASRTRNLKEFREHYSALLVF